MAKLITRKEYMEDSENLYDVYYSQFVNDEMKRDILSIIGKKKIIKKQI